jgi:hypothetical protein
VSNVSRPEPSRRTAVRTVRPPRPALCRILMAGYGMRFNITTRLSGPESSFSGVLDSVLSSSTSRSSGVHCVMSDIGNTSRKGILCVTLHSIPGITLVCFQSFSWIWLLFVKFLLARSTRTQAALVDQLFNNSEKRLARILLLMAEFGKPGEPEPLIPSITRRHWRRWSEPPDLA